MELRDMCINKVRKNKCKALVVDMCLGSECPFRKTQKQQYETKSKVFKRLSKLEITHQVYIADKYYGGEMTWQKGGRRI